MLPNKIEPVLLVSFPSSKIWPQTPPSKIVNIVKVFKLKKIKILSHRWIAGGFEQMLLRGLPGVARKSRRFTIFVFYTPPPTVCRYMT